MDYFAVAKHVCYGMPLAPEKEDAVTTRADLEASLDRLGETAMKIKLQRDTLLLACRFAYARALQTRGPADDELLDVLSDAIALGEKP